MCIYVGTIYTYVYIVYLCIYIEKCGPLLILSLRIEQGGEEETYLKDSQETGTQNFVPV